MRSTLKEKAVQSHGKVKLQAQNLPYTSKQQYRLKQKKDQLTKDRSRSLKSQISW